MYHVRWCNKSLLVGVFFFNYIYFFLCFLWFLQTEIGILQEICHSLSEFIKDFINHVLLLNSMNKLNRNSYIRHLNFLSIEKRKTSIVTVIHTSSPDVYRIFRAMQLQRHSWARMLYHMCKMYTVILVNRLVNIITYIL